MESTPAAIVLAAEQKNYPASGSCVDENALLVSGVRGQNGQTAQTTNWSGAKTCRMASLDAPHSTGRLIRHLAERGGPNKVAGRGVVGGWRVGSAGASKRWCGVFPSFQFLATEKSVFVHQLKVKITEKKQTCGTKKSLKVW